MTQLHPHPFKLIARIGLYCALPLLLFPLLEWAALSSYGASIFTTLELFLILPGLLACLLLIMAPIGLFFPAVRWAALYALIGAVVYLGASYFGFQIQGQIRHGAFEALAQRSSPLVEAITAYTRDKGSPPPSLEALVPQYLAEVPTTGIRIYPRYEYLSGSTAAEYEGNPWILSIPCSRSFLNFDTFLYFPRQNYPDSGYGGTFERIRDWAYLHE